MAVVEVFGTLVLTNDGLVGAAVAVWVVIIDVVGTVDVDGTVV